MTSRLLIILIIITLIGCNYDKQPEIHKTCVAGYWKLKHSNGLMVQKNLSTARRPIKIWICTEWKIDTIY